MYNEPQNDADYSILLEDLAGMLRAIFSRNKDTHHIQVDDTFCYDNRGIRNFNRLFKELKPYSAGIKPSDFAKFWNRIVTEKQYSFDRAFSMHAKIAYVYLRGKPANSDKHLGFGDLNPKEWWSYALEKVKSSVSMIPEIPSDDHTSKASSKMAIGIDSRYISGFQSHFSQSRGLVVRAYPQKLTPIYKAVNCIEALPEELRLINAGFEHSNIVTINGTGGIGKSTLANVYLHKNLDRYDHLAWLSVNDKKFEHLYDPADVQSLFESALGLAIKLEIPFHLPAEERFKEALSTLSQISGNNLLVIDNAGPALADYWNYLNSSGWQVLITSRYNFPNSMGDARIELKGVSDDVALKIFNLFRYGKEDGGIEADLPTIRKIIEPCKGLPLLIMLLGRLGYQNNLPVGVLYELLNKEGLLLGDDFIVSIDSGITDPQSYIARLFPLFGMQTAELRLLSFFAIMPHTNIPMSHILQLSWETEIRKTLLRTYTFGWISQSESEQVGTAYGMHSLVKEVIKNKYPPTFEGVKYLIEGVLTGMTKLTGQNDALVDKSDLVGYAESIYDVTKSAAIEPTIDYITFINTIANRYGKDIKEFEKAFLYSDIALKLNEQLFHANPTSEVIRYLSIIYKNRAMYACGIAEYAERDTKALNIPAIRQYNDALAFLKKSNYYVNLLAGQSKYHGMLQNLHEYRHICERIYDHEQTPDDERKKKLTELLDVNDAISGHHKIIHGEHLPVFNNPHDFESAVTITVDYSKRAWWLLIAGKLTEAIPIFTDTGIRLKGFIEHLVTLAEQNPNLPSLANKKLSLLEQLDGALDCYVYYFSQLPAGEVKIDKMLSTNFAWLIDRFLYFIRKNLWNECSHFPAFSNKLTTMKLRCLQETERLLPFCESVYGSSSLTVKRIIAFKTSIISGID